MIKNHFKTAWRSILNNKGTALINISGLSLGITAAVFILLWVQNEINFDNYHPGADRIYRLTTNIKENNWIWETSPLLLAEAIKKDVPEVKDATKLYHGNWAVFNINSSLIYEKTCAYVDESWFDIFQYDFIAGNAKAFKNDAKSIILTASQAKKYFGERDAMGTVIRVDSMDYVVKGIVKDAPANSSFQYTSFIPLVNLLKDPDRRANDEQWQNANYITFAKFESGSNLRDVTNKITAVYEKNSGDRQTFMSLIALKDMHFETEIQNSVFSHGNKNTVYIFSILAFLLLLVACINYVNLTTAKASLRAKEVSVRKMVGANRIQLFYQFVTEAFLVSLLSLLATLILIQVGLPYFNLISGKNFAIPLTSVNMWRIIGITLLATLLLNSIYPAFLLSSFKPLRVFRGNTLLVVNDKIFRKGLVVLQFTISVILVASTIIIYSQMQFIQHSDPGYKRSQVVSFPLPPSIGGARKETIIKTLKTQLLAQSSIQGVTVCNQPIINIGSISTGSADWDGHDTAYNPKIAQLSTDADFQKTMQLQMNEGRWFENEHEGDRNNVILNETAVATLKIHQPVIGQRFTFKGRVGRVIGVVKDFNYKSLHDKTGPLVAFNDPKWQRFFMVRLASENTLEAVKAINNVWNDILPGNPLEYNFLDDTFNELYKEDRQVSSLILIFAIIAVVISSLGLFGLASFTAEQRTKEIGIRKVLGATVSNITTLLSKDFVKLVCVAILIATPVAFWAMNTWIQNFAYRIDIKWWMFVAAGLFALMIALVTTSLQAVKAALANPVRSLRTE